MTARTPRGAANGASLTPSESPFIRYKIHSVASPLAGTAEVAILEMEKGEWSIGQLVGWLVGRLRLTSIHANRRCKGRSA